MMASEYETNDGQWIWNSYSNFHPFVKYVSCLKFGFKSLFYFAACVWLYVKCFLILGWWYKNNWIVFCLWNSLCNSAYCTERCKGSLISFFLPFFLSFLLRQFKLDPKLFKHICSFIFCLTSQLVFQMTKKKKTHFLHRFTVLIVDILWLFCWKCKRSVFCILCNIYISIAKYFFGILWSWHDSCASLLMQGGSHGEWENSTYILW